MKISIAIPLYNAERYLPACLGSLLDQTLTDFEVIIVDDCSTDNSVAVAESFLPRFGGRMKIISLPANTGSGAVPRNEGLKFSRGEFVFFMDADDMLAANALEKLLDAAQSFQADVVCMNRGFICNENMDHSKTLMANWDSDTTSIETPTLEPTDFVTRLNKLLAAGYSWAPWTKFLRRDFLIANDIKFPAMRISEDVIWTMELVCTAGRWLTFPEQLYMYRRSDNSMMRSKRSPADEIIFWLDPLVKGLDVLEKFMDDIKFFAFNPGYRFDVTNFFVKMQLAGMLGAMKDLTPRELYEVVHRKVSADGTKHAALIANLMVFMNYYRSK
ncbi:MAG: glycosyltransferase [Quinella sp. 2Q5]|nr:glycosyltransferase [Quinella sp. 2Q5]